MPRIPDPRPKPKPSSDWWLGAAVVSFALLLGALYLGQGLPSLIYVGLVLGLLIFSIVALLIHHFIDLVSLGRHIRLLIRQSRANALIFLGVGIVAVVLKLLGVW